MSPRAGPPGSNSRPSIPRAEGPNEIRAQARDWVGNESALSAPGWVMRDTQPPVIQSAGV
jgi:hypothetical protein